MDKPLSSGASHSLCLANTFQSQLPWWRCSGVPDRMREIAEETTSSLATSVSITPPSHSPGAALLQRQLVPSRDPRAVLWGLKGCDQILAQSTR